MATAAADTVESDKMAPVTQHQHDGSRKKHGSNRSGCMAKLLSILVGCLVGLALAMRLFPDRGSLSVAWEWQDTFPASDVTAISIDDLSEPRDTYERLYDDLPAMSGEDEQVAEVSKEMENSLQQTNGTQNPVKVLLVAYFRGGSTFLGEVFNQNEDVFYMFEPLAAPVFAYKAEHHTRDYILNSKEKILSRPRSLVNNLLQIVHTILNCDIAHVDRHVLQHYFTVKWRRSKKLLDYQKCVSTLSRENGNNVTTDIVKACEDYITSQCSHSKVKVIKAIRLLLNEVEVLVRKDPDVKIIFYVRDPRGTLLSRWNVGYGRYTPAKVGMNRVHDTASYLCAKMRSDLRSYYILRDRNPRNILLVKYEDLAENPTETVDRIYDFVGAEVPDNIRTWIQGATHAQKNDGQVGSRRLNSTAIAEKWREELPSHVQNAIISHCIYVLRKLGYSTKVT